MSNEKINPALASLVVPLSTLHPDPNNAQKHGAKNLQAIKDSIIIFGMQKPMVALTDGTVIAGNGTLEALIDLGWEKAPVVRFDNAEKAKAWAYALADNRTSALSTVDENQLVKNLREIKIEMPEFNVEQLGFNQGEILKLLGQEEAREKEKAEPLRQGNITTLITCPHCGGQFEGKAVKKSTDDQA